MGKADKRARKKENHAKARAAAEAAAKKQERTSNIKRIAGIIAVVAVAGGLVAVLLNDGGDDETTDTSTTAAVTTAPATSSTGPTTTTAVTVDPALTYTATITTSKGTIALELDTAGAPNATQQFLNLAESGFYDGLTFHRVIDGFMIQGGDPNGDGTGGSGTSVVGEVPTDHYPIGSLAAAKATAEPAGTFDSQFFIVTGSQGATLPNDYARFGTVTEGLDVAQAIAALQDGDSDTPSETVTIESITISTAAADATTTTTTAE